MTRSKFAIGLTLSAGLMLSACTDPEYAGIDRTNTKQGAAIGAAIGGIFGAAVSDDKGAGAIRGAAVGAGVGALIGDDLDKQATDLRRKVSNGNVVITNTGDRLIVTLPQDILFATDSTFVRSDLQRDLRAIAGNLLAYPNSTIQILGHTDNTGSAAYNQDLSLRRAQAVTAVLQDAGVPSSRMRAIGRGEDQPVASNLTAEGRAQNRRVEIVILPNA
ncbi:OmpA family protein [Cognatishimia maritima]|uniref:Outer membrane protein OmpA n=1 Tax=Cognatishimia maritima TaxID=870908 RepID=A0A1M5SR47_9RHOB|nr:OmpA family protein [Cognatishimia maritima]SHH40965.1 Outer membrane protein OmpA [Cognatishimia maritima]